MSMDTSGRSAVVRSPMLGVLWLIYGIFRGIAAIWLLTFAPQATVMFGALLVRVANPYPLMGAFHIIYTGWIAISVGSAVFCILTGILLLAGSGAVRTFALLAAFFSIPFLPLGTTLGTYTLVLFLRRD